MQNFFVDLKKEIFPIGLILILALSRLIPHPDNFTPIIALAIMGSHFFKSINFSYLVVLFSMLIADFFIGFYSHMLFVYLSLFSNNGLKPSLGSARQDLSFISEFDGPNSLLPSA